MKQNDISSATKIAILNAANQVVLQKGAEALTLEMVAREAGVSKGGLLYHFPTKRMMIEGMIDRLINHVENSLQEAVKANGGKFLDAFISISIPANPEHNQISCALIAAIADDPALLIPLQAQYRLWQEQCAAAAPSPEIGTLIRWRWMVYGFLILWVFPLRRLSCRKNYKKCCFPCLKNNRAIHLAEGQPQ